MEKYYLFNLSKNRYSFSIYIMDYTISKGTKKRTITQSHLYYDPDLSQSHYSYTSRKGRFSMTISRNKINRKDQINETFLFFASTQTSG